MFVDNSSVAEVGTSRASVNHTGKSNATKVVHTMSTENSTSVKLKDIYVLPSWLCLE